MALLRLQHLSLADPWLLRKMETPRPYQTRERLFYQADSINNTAQPKDSPLKPQVANREFVLDQIPQGSLYDSVLEPASPASKRVVMEEAAPPRSTIVECQDGRVTVFGFPNGKSPAILQLFQQLGPIEAHEAGHGNWLHLKFASPWTVQRALAKNGTLCNVETVSSLIGVIPRGQVEGILQHETQPISTSTIMEVSLHREPNVFTQEDQPLVHRLLKSVFGL